MKKLRKFLCMFLTVTLLAGDVSLSAVHAEPAEVSISGNDMESTISGNDMDSNVSDNELEQPMQPEESPSVSENEASVSSNDLTEESVLSEEAREALHSLAVKKMLMALVYLTDSYTVRQEPNLSSDAVVTVSSGQMVLIQDVEITDGAIWYLARLDVNGTEYEGYLEREYLAYSDEDFILWENTYLLPFMNQKYGEVWKQQSQDRLFNSGSSTSTGYNDIDAFPGSYQKGLVALKKQYPKWIFVKLDVTDQNFDDVVNAQYGERSYIYSTASADYKDGQTGQANWYYASKKAIAYYLDPRNHFSESEVFQFEQLSYNASYHSEGALEGILSSTFMAGSIPKEGKTYAKAFVEIGSKYGVSPYHLASRVVQEQGTKGTSPLISGTYPGYQGYYNYFNVGATGNSDDAVIRNGLAYAKSKGWNTRYKALEGGAATIGNNYIKIGQNTLYLQKFQVIKAGNHNLYTHQYMQNIQAPATEGNKTRNTYDKSGSLNNSFVFRIPVYSNMPATIKRIQISETEHTLTIRQTEVNGEIQAQQDSFQLKAVAVDLDEKEQPEYPITWKSSDTKVATVDKNGVVTSVKEGTATISAAAEGKTAKCVVTVKAPLYSMEIIPPSGEMYVGSTRKLSVRYVPFDTTDAVEQMRWTSSDEAVATVEKGLLTGVGKGKAVITASVTGEDGTVHTASFEVTVKPCIVHFYKPDGEEWELWESRELNYADILEGIFPEETTLPGHEQEVFSGWYTKPDGAGSRCFNSTVIYGDMDIYPYFISTQQDFFVKNVGDYTYTGLAIKPEVEVYDQDVLLIKDVDYTVSYANNKAAADETAKKRPTIVVKGKGNYSGTQKIYFNIVPKDIKQKGITVEDLLYAYTGKTITPSPAVYHDGKKLKKGTDYTVTCPAQGQTGAYMSAGVFPVEITGINNYTETRKVYMTITKNVLMSKASVASIKAQEYKDGNPIEPVLKVTYKGKPLTLGEDYTVSYQNNREIGTATATITAVPKAYDSTVTRFSGSKTVNFKITGISMSKVKVTGITSQLYCGKPITIFEEDGSNSGFFPDYKITYTSQKVTTDLILGKDYTVSYSKNEAKGKGTITFTGINRYTGTLKKSFTIGAYDLAANADGYVYLETENLGEHKYSRAGVKPKVKLYFKGMDGAEELLQEGVDYTLSYKNNTKVNDASNPEIVPSVTIKGKGRFKGTWKDAAFFTVGAKSMEEGQDSGITVNVTDFIYKEGTEEYPPKLVVKDNGKTLKKGKDYQIVSFGVINQEENGTMEYEAVIEALKKADGSREYTGTRTVTYRVYISSLKNASILSIPAQTYADKPAKSEAGICPEIKVTYKIRNSKEAELFNSLCYEKYDTAKKEVTGVADGDTIILKKGDTVLLRENRDYAFRENSYQNNKKKGTANVTVYGVNLFAESKSAGYKIVSRVLVSN